MKNLIVFASVRSLLFWIKENFLLSLTLFLVVFIPLWPKIPLFQPIPGYIVRVRLEDLFVGIASLVWLAQVVRKKIPYKTPLNIWMELYLVVGFLSLLSAMFVIKTFPILFTHVAKAFLVWLRYIEYFTLFFFAYASIKKPSHAQLLLSAFFLTVIGAAFYAVGQKYWQWPVYSTMTWEFSTGIALELASPFARVQSTFAGHYDFAIFLDLLLPFLLISFFANSARNKKKNIFLGAILTMAIWSLIVSGLRSAFIGFLLTIPITALLTIFSPVKIPLRSVITKLSMICVLTALLFLLFGSNLFALLNQTINRAASKDVIAQYELPVPRNQPHLPSENTNAQPMNLSSCAKQHEISLCIRWDSLWPQAVKGFMREPLLGSGFSTLNKPDFMHIAEADGVDNNYLRILGETGVLGFVTFFSIIGAALFLAIKKFHSKDRMSSILSMSYISTIFCLLFNAFLFDVFASSKVAFTFWALTGLVVGYWINAAPQLPHKESRTSIPATSRRLRH